MATSGECTVVPERLREKRSALGIPNRRHQRCGPRLGSLSQQAGGIYYCVTADAQQFWVTMTGLHEDVSRTGTLKRVADGSYDKPWLITATGEDYAPPAH